MAKVEEEGSYSPLLLSAQKRFLKVENGVWKVSGGSCSLISILYRISGSQFIPRVGPVHAPCDSHHTCFNSEKVDLPRFCNLSKKKPLTNLN